MASRGIDGCRNHPAICRLFPLWNGVRRAIIFNKRIKENPLLLHWRRLSFGKQGGFYMSENTNREIFINVAGFQCLDQLQHNAVDIYLSTCGIQNCFPGHYYGPGKREEYIIHFISSGKGIFEAEGRTYHLTKGDFLSFFREWRFTTRRIIISPGTISGSDFRESRPPLI